MFEPIDKADDIYSPNLYKTIVERIRSMIKEGTLKVGDKLPSERELADLFQVSRVPVREALKILDFMGIVQYVRGEGVYIKGLSISDLVEKMDFVVEPSADILLELFDAREALEIKAVHLACQNSTKSDIDKMRKSIERMDTVISGGKAGVTASLQFHSLVVKASHNRVLMRIYENLMEVMELARKRSLSVRDRVRQPGEFHKQILDAIVQQDADSAVRIMQDHLKDARKALVIATNDSARVSKGTI